MTETVTQRLRSPEKGRAAWPPSTPLPQHRRHRRRRRTSSTPPPGWSPVTPWRHRTAGRSPRSTSTAASARSATAELEDAVVRFAAALIASGVRPEERLLLCMGDTPELLTAFLAGLRIGAVPVPVSTMLKPKDIAAHRPRQPRPHAGDQRGVRRARASRRRAPRAGRRRRRDHAEQLPEVAGTRVRDWDAFVTAGADFLEQARAPYPTIPDSPAFWLYTSGTTGTPKGAMHRHGSLRDTAETYARDVLAIGPDDVTFSVAKFFFAYGLGNTLTFPFSVGASTVLDRSRPSPAGTLRILRRAAPDALLRRPHLLLGPARPPGCRRTRSPACGSACRPARRSRPRCSSGSPPGSASRCSTASARPRCCTSSSATGRAGCGRAPAARSSPATRPASRTTTGIRYPTAPPGTSTCAAAPRPPATGAAPRSPAGCSRGRGCAPATPTCARPTATTPRWAAPTTSSRPAASGSPRPRSRSGSVSTPT